MFTVPTTYIEYSGVLYKILRTVREDHRPIVENWKEYLNADMVLRKEGILYFLEKIEEAQFAWYL